MKIELSPRAVQMLRHTYNGRVPVGYGRSLGLLRSKGLVKRNSRELTAYGHYWAGKLHEIDWSRTVGH